eukprot:1901537-Rhodomonas_salina.3
MAMQLMTRTVGSGYQPGFGTKCPADRTLAPLPEALAAFPKVLGKMPYTHTRCPQSVERRVLPGFGVPREPSRLPLYDYGPG